MNEALRNPRNSSRSFEPLNQEPAFVRTEGDNRRLVRTRPLKTEDAKSLIDEQIDSLSAALEAGHSETLTAFLGAMAKFHRYSLGNVLLIMTQFPDATHVAGFNTWKSLGRFVKPGEKGIAILAPMLLKARDESSQDSLDGAAFPNGSSEKTSEDDQERHLRFRVVYVFDVSQTDGEPLPDFTTVQGDPGDSTDRLRSLARQLSIELDYSENLGGAFGVSRGGRITLKEGLDPATEFTTLVHELAHEILHHGEGRQGTTKTSRELEAEAVAFIVAQAVGLDTGTASSDYIQLYKGDKELLTKSLDSIRKAAGTILEAIVG